jgi:chitin synthase
MAASEGYRGINPFVEGLFSSGALKLEASARSEDTIISAQKSVGPMCMPNVRRKGTVRRSRVERVRMNRIQEDEEDEGPFVQVKKEKEAGLIHALVDDRAEKAAGVAGSFKEALDTLFETLDETQAWCILCVNSNDSQPRSRRAAVG